MRVRLADALLYPAQAMDAAAELAAALDALETLKAAVAQRSASFREQLASQMATLEGYFQNAKDLLDTYAQDPSTSDEKWAVLMEGCRALTRVCKAATVKVEAAAGGDEVLDVLRQAKEAVKSLFPWWITGGIALGLGLFIYNSLKERP